MTDNTDFLDLRLDHGLSKSGTNPNVKVVDLNGASRQKLANALSRGDYKRIAPFGTFSIDQPPDKTPLKQNPDYAIFKSWIKSTAPLRDPATVNCASLPARGVTSGLAGVSNFLGVWSGFTTFIPSQNPYAKSEGLDCGESAEALNELRCRWDSKFNPLNNQVICTRIKAVQVISDSSQKKVCAVQTQILSFDCSSDRCKADFNDGRLLGSSKSWFQSDQEFGIWMAQLQKKYSIKAELLEKSFPEDAGVL